MIIDLFYSVLLINNSYTWDLSDLHVSVLSDILESVLVENEE